MATTLYLVSSNTVADLWSNGDSWSGLTASLEQVTRYGLSTSRGSASTQSVDTGSDPGPVSGLEVANLYGYSADIWVSAPLAAAATISGSISFAAWASEQNMAANAAINYRILAAQPDGTVVEKYKTARTTELSTTAGANNWNETPGTSFSFAKGDRIILSPYFDDASTMADGYLLKFWYNGPTADAEGDSYVTFTETLSFQTSSPTGTTIYLTDTASAVSTPSVDREAWTSRGAGVQTDVTNTTTGDVVPGIQVTDTAAGTVVDWFTKPLSAFTLSGVVLANIRMTESNIAANAQVEVELAIVDGDGTNPTVWAKASRGTEAPTIETAYQWFLAGPDTSIANGKRIRIRVLVQDAIIVSGGGAAMATAQTTTLYYAGTSPDASGDSYLTFGQTLTEYVTTERVPYRSHMPQLLAH